MSRRYHLKYKRQSLGLKLPQLPNKKYVSKTTITQPQRSAEKLMLRVLYDFQAHMLEYYQEKRSTINSARYSGMLTSMLKPEIRRKRRQLLFMGVVFFLDNSPVRQRPRSGPSLKTWILGVAPFSCSPDPWSNPWFPERSPTTTNIIVWSWRGNSGAFARNIFFFYRENTEMY